MSENERNDVIEPPPAYSFHQHACITLNSSDRFRLIRFPPIITNVVRQAIVASWPNGLQREEDYLGAYEFKLNGNPWWGQGYEAITSRVLMFHIISALYNHGWYLLTSTNTSKKDLERDALYFHHGVVPPQTPFFAVSFHEFNKLCLIGVPPELIPAIHQSLDPFDIQREKWLDKGMTYQFKFKFRGNPLISSEEESIYSRIKLLSLLDCLSRFGWKLYASIDMSQGNVGRDTDTWFFRRDIQ